MNSSFKETIESIKPVAQLEGWDESRLEELIDQYDKGSNESREALHLLYDETGPMAVRYMRIRRLRTEEFWIACKIGNNIEFREYRDLRELANKLEVIYYGKRKKAKKSKAEVTPESPGV